MSTLEFHNRFYSLSVVLKAFALSLTKNKEDAKDLFQETAIRVMVNQEKFAPGTNFKAWVFTIMKNIFINDYRKRQKVKVVFEGKENLFYLNKKPKVTNEAESNMLIDELSLMIAELEESLRVPFILHYEGYKYQEIALELGLPVGTVKSRIFFARKALKQKIQQQYVNISELQERIKKKRV